ncbi:holo-ACP synthase [Piscinibacter sakaiensis]|uniref:Holo-[acyl-carrier-protein] synthase n=1 Tax=Piscinibacter sakaiensis TaxID=1547922 RepID=A0A0K8NZP5_PISS1|nr:holo-ACP synthase [Piscinibacter sakaiensis]GAP35848.1 hypothetical protein ISF6_1621 [Piscinibacter sakaiensis]
MTPPARPRGAAHPSPADAPAAGVAGPVPAPALRVGIDTVDVAGVATSLDAFGERYARRLFTDGERAAAERVPSARAERLAARFAAKEAFLKAFDAAETGLGWREIEVVGEAGQPPRLRLHGAAAARAAACGARELALSLSHDGAQACAMLVALCDPVARAGEAAAPDARPLFHFHPAP